MARRDTCKSRPAPTGREAWAVEPYDPFFNANTPEDLAAAQDIVGAHGEA